MFDGNSATLRITDAMPWFCFFSTIGVGDGLVVVEGVRRSDKEVIFVGVNVSPVSVLNPKLFTMTVFVWVKMEEREWYTIRGVVFRIASVFESTGLMEE